MKEYKGYGGSKVQLDGNNIFIKQLLIKENCTIADIRNIIFEEPSALKNGCLTIDTQKNHFELYFLKKNTPEFLELYDKLCSGLNINKNHESSTLDEYDLKFKDKGAGQMHYVVLQVVLKEKFIGTGSGNLSELENVINTQASKGYRLHTISTSASGSKGMLGGDRIQATLVFEKLL